MKNIIVIVAIIFITTSCRQKLTDKHFKSFDEATGGFDEISLDLKSSGKLVLQLKTTKIISNSDSGAIDEILSKTVNGSWTLEEGKIKCVFDEEKIKIDNFYSESESKDIVSKQLIKFSKNQDTAYIYGISCVQ